MKGPEYGSTSYHVPDDDSVVPLRDGSREVRNSTLQAAVTALRSQDTPDHARGLFEESEDGTERAKFQAQEFYSTASMSFVLDSDALPEDANKHAVPNTIRERRTWGVLQPSTGETGLISKSSSVSSAELSSLLDCERSMASASEYVAVVVGTLCTASIGAAVRAVPQVPGIIVASWLMQLQTLVLVPFALARLGRVSQDRRREQCGIIQSLALCILTAAVGRSITVSGFFVAEEYSSLVRAWALGMSHPIILTFCGVVAARGRLDPPLQVVGALLAFCGAGITQVPVLFGRDVKAFLVDIFAFTCSAGQAVFLRSCTSLSDSLPVTISMTFVSALCAAFLSVIACVTGMGDYTFSERGVFGWMSGDRIWFALYLGVVVGLLGNVMTMSAVGKVPVAVVAVGQALVPPIGTTMAVICGIDRVPDVFTVIGVCLMVLGFAIIAQETARKKQEAFFDLHSPVV